MPFFSIITINLNNAIGLKKTIDSVVSQSFTDYEFIIVDGGSTDESIAVIRKFENKITYWISEKDNGIYNAQNKGITKANGKYCFFLNAGDCLCANNILQKVFDFNPEHDIVYGNMQTMEINGLIVHRKMPDKIGIMQLYADTLWHPVSFIRRELFHKYGFYDEQFKIVSDYEFFVRVIICKKVSAKHLPLEISLFDRAGISSDNNNVKRLMEERSKVQDMYFNPGLLFLFRIYSKLRR